MAQAGVNRSELRTLVQGAFSAAQIVELARAWGIEAAPEWSRSSSDAAHGLLREGEKRLGIHECVRRLKAADPLIEWPEVEPDASAEWGPKSGPAPSAATPAQAADPETTVVATPDAIRAAAAGGAPPSKTIAAEPLAPARAPSAAPAPFPGTVSVEPKRAGLDPKILVAVVGGVLAIALLAFGAGLLFSRSGSSGATASGSPSASTRVGPALLAAMVLENSLVDVASRCSVPYDEHASKDVLTLALAYCDRRAPADDDDSVAPRRSPTATRPVDVPDAEEPSRTSRPTPVPRDPATRPTPAGGGCLSKCKSARSSCMSACGHEPSDASKYDEYSGCTSKCVSAESRCRLACN